MPTHIAIMVMPDDKKKQEEMLKPPKGKAKAVADNDDLLTDEAAKAPQEDPNNMSFIRPKGPKRARKWSQNEPKLRI